MHRNDLFRSGSGCARVILHQQDHILGCHAVPQGDTLENDREGTNVHDAEPNFSAKQVDLRALKIPITKNSLSSCQSQYPSKTHILGTTFQLWSILTIERMNSTMMANTNGGLHSGPMQESGSFQFSIGISHP